MHNSKDFRFGVTDCKVRIGKIYTYITPKYTNCGEKHQAITFKYPARAKVRAKIWREKFTKF